MVRHFLQDVLESKILILRILVYMIIHVGWDEVMKDLQYWSPSSMDRSQIERVVGAECDCVGVAELVDHVERSVGVEQLGQNVQTTSSRRVIAQADSKRSGMFTVRKREDPCNLSRHPSLQVPSHTIATASLTEFTEVRNRSGLV